MDRGALPASQSAVAIIADYRRILSNPISVDGMGPFAVPTLDPIADPSRPCALILSPHPDDECLTGALPSRLRDDGWRIVNLAVTLGSDSSRRRQRLNELGRACGTLGFEIALPREDALDAVRIETRSSEPELWRGMVRRVSAVVAALRPALILMPHGEDGHPAHIGTHYLGIDALATMERGFSCHVALTEYWQNLSAPNLMIGIGDEHAARLLTALACHAGENARNPFDIRFPAFLIDNVRRGAERVGGAGAAAAALDFAMLYQTGLWRDGRYMPSALSRIVMPDQTIGDLFEI